MRHIWTEADDALLRKHYHKMGSRVRHLLPTKTNDAIWGRAVKLGLCQHRKGFGRRLSRASIRPEQLTSEQAAYVAGLLDGEGHIRFGPRFGQRADLKGFGTRITITNTHVGALSWLKETLGGGHIAAHAQTGLTRKACFHYGIWRVRDCYNLAKVLLPYSIIKRDELAALVVFCEEEFLIQYDDLVQPQRSPQ